MPPRPYQDNPFEGSASRVDVNDYYGDVPPAHHLSAGPYSTTSIPAQGFQNIPLSQRHNQDSASPFSDHQHYQQSTDDLTPTPIPVSAGYGMSSGRYADLQQERSMSSSVPWQQPQPPKSNRKKWIIIGSILALVGLIVVGVAVAVTLVKKNSNRTSSSSSSSSGSTSSNGTNPNDPSSFTKNPAFRQAFWGMSYTPVGSQLPNCGNSLSGVIGDIQLMSQLTTRIHLYGADCNQSALVLEAIKQTKVNMTVWLANYNLPTDNGAAYLRQRGELQQAIQTYGTHAIGGVTIGNEFMLDYMTANGITDANSAEANVGAKILVANIQDTRSMLAGMNLPNTLPVGTADAGAYFNNLVLEAVDYGMANVHPWFANVSIDQAAAWTNTFFQENDVSLAAGLSNNPKMYIAETGWPTNSSNLGNESNGPSTASVSNLQVFLDTYVCQANANGTEYFFFEFADEEWKNIQFGGVEGYWGLFNQNYTLKDPITIPDCISP